MRGGLVTVSPDRERVIDALVKARDSIERSVELLYGAAPIGAVIGSSATILFDAIRAIDGAKYELQKINEGGA